MYGCLGVWLHSAAPVHPGWFCNWEKTGGEGCKCTMLDHCENKGAHGRFEFLSSLYPLVKSGFCHRRRFCLNLWERSAKKIGYVYLCILCQSLWNVDMKTVKQPESLFLLIKKKKKKKFKLVIIKSFRPGKLSAFFQRKVKMAHHGPTCHRKITLHAQNMSSALGEFQEFIACVW